MEFIVCENYNEISRRAAELVKEQMINKSDSVLGLATGSTPIGLYNNLVKMNLDFSEVKTFNLDEYYPISRGNDQSYYYFMNKHLYSRVNLKPENIHIPNGATTNPEEECENYDKAIDNCGGIDLQILGIGQNGHIGFNEPGANINLTTHLVKLTQNTIEANARFFETIEDVPTRALTMGIGSIFKARKIILLASGANKSKAISELMGNNITTDNPATMLKLHPDVVVICDKEAYAQSQIRLGIDIGGTDIKFAVIESNELKYKSKIKTNTDSAEGLIEDLSKEVREISQKYKINAVGVGTPGLINNGLITAVNLPFKDFPLESELKKKLNMPVVVDNDANCAALGETMMEKEIKMDNMVMITLGTGVGGGIIINKRICHGDHGMGEIGHLIVQANNGIPCPCGQYGCWEQYASVTALIKNANEAIEKNPTSILAGIYKKNGKINGKLFFDALSQKCNIAQQVFEEYVDWLVVGIKSLINIFGPDVIVLGGGITKDGDLLINEIKKRIPTNILIKISKLQNDAGSIGAAMLI